MSGATMPAPERRGVEDDTGCPDICIIGAGSSGVAVAKALKERGIAFACYETGSDIGGMWRYRNDNGMSSAYAALHIDTSRDNLGYPDFPIPKHLPDFLSHAQFLAHLEAYADHFGIRPLITFRTSVTRVMPMEDGRWQVSLSDGRRIAYRHVVVANGHLWDPRLPEFPGKFDGTTLHAHHYRTSDPFEGRRVLVVGLGNSAVDIAVDLCRRAAHVAISTRRGAWIMPKYLMGVPVDRWSALLSRRLHLPTRLTRMIMARLIRLGVGDQRRFGLPRPAHPMWREHATLSQDLLPAIGHGRITVRPDIARLDGDGVVFTDGVRDPFDAIIYATGYRTSFPFLDPGLARQALGDESRPALYRRILSPACPGLAFAGLVQPIGPTIPLVEIQARWLASLLSGAMAPAGPEDQRREIARHHAVQRRTWLDSPRYALEVDYKTYARQLRRDMARGQAGI